MELKAFEPEVLALADALRARGWRLATAESCTGGLIAAACTAVAGSSDWFERGFVTYSNAAKTEMLGVDAALDRRARRRQRSRWRAPWRGARCARARVELGVAVTGIAGPGRRHAGQAGGHGVAGAGRGRGAAGGRRSAPSACSSTATAPRCASRPCVQALQRLRAALG